VEDAQAVLDAGADKVAVSSAALRRPELLSEMADVFGSQCVVVSIDAKWQGQRYEAFLNGGREPTGRDAIEWAIESTGLGAGEILLNSIDRDGTTGGYELDLTSAVADATAVPVIASGGAGELKHLVEAITVGKADAVLCASIFHYGQHTVEEAKQFMAGNGIPVRV
jgi:cyclase